MRRRFFVQRFEGRRAFLRGDEAGHLARVLRAEPGQLYELSDGAAVWLARIERGERDAVEFALVESLSSDAGTLDIRLLLAIIKFDRFEWCLEKATELGVSEIVPLAAAHSEKNLIAAAEKRAQRWTRILLESAQQSRRVRPPTLRATLKPEPAFTETHAALKLLLSERSEAPAMRHVVDRVLQQPGSGDVTPDHAALALSAESAKEGTVSTPAETQATRSIALAVGPEGGWTGAELAAARAAGFAEASLGRNILRTETAVIASLAVLNYALGD
jgi:16S rRNA (uracil1498-N3)-methyltransferase